MQQVVQVAVLPDSSIRSKNEIVRKRSATSNDSSIDEREDNNDLSVPQQRPVNSKVSRSVALDDHIVKLIDSKVDSINDNFKAFLKEVRGIKEEIGDYVKPRPKAENVKNREQSGQDEELGEQFMNWKAEAQEIKKTLNWSPLDDIMMHSQVFRKAANNERQSLEPTKRVSTSYLLMQGFSCFKAKKVPQKSY